MSRTVTEPTPRSPGRPRDPAAFVAVLGALRALVPRASLSIVPVAVLSILGAAGEALVLVLVVRMAAMLAAGEQSTSVSLGPVDTSRVELADLALLGVGVLVTLVLLTTAVAVLSARLGARSVAHARRALLRAYLASTWAVQSAERPGRLQELMSGHAQRLATASNVLTNALTAAFNVAVLAATAVLLDPRLAVVMAGGALVMFVLLRPIRRAVKRAARRQARLASALAAETGEVTPNTRDIRVFGAAEPVTARVSTRVADVAGAMTRTFFLMRVSPGLYQYTAFAIVVVGLALLGQGGAAEIASLGAVIILLIRALSYGQRLSSAAQSAIECVPYLAMFREELARFQQHAEQLGTARLEPVDSLELRDVDFSYLPGVRVLRAVSFTVRRGEVIGIVGPSGGGKSTLAQILLRLHRPEAGEYLVNGRSVTDYDRETWARRIAFVPQDNRLARGTVAENIDYHRGLGDRVVEAAEAAHVRAEVESLPEGFETLVGPGAIELSGGQRQRLGLARALAGGPDVIVLDEPTSALDPRSEQLVQETLTGVRGEVTLLIVAHRISTLDICDKILVVEDGRVRAFGTPDEVRVSSAYFAHASRRSLGAGTPTASVTGGVTGVVT